MELTARKYTYQTQTSDVQEPDIFVCTKPLLKGVNAGTTHAHFKPQGNFFADFGPYVFTFSPDGNLYNYLTLSTMMFI